MATKFKGIYKSFKYITQIFVVKEREMEIGYPTDVKHVAHVGWDGPLGNGPSWMDDFNTAPDFSTSLGNLSELRDNSNSMAVTDLWSSQEREQSSNIYNSIPSAGVPYSPEKSRQKKIKSATSSSSQSRPASSRRPKAAKSKAMYSAAREATPIALM